jgi:hypothetical protein
MKKDQKTIPIKTLWNGKAWVHQKYLRRAKLLKEGLVLEYKGKIMTVEPERIDPLFWTKGDREFRDQFNGGEPYYLWGIHFVDDKLTN